MTGAVTALASELPEWVTLLRAPNPGPMTLDGTNTWLLRAPGATHGVVVDPGPADEGHLAAIAAWGPIGLVLITHGHGDHTEASPRLHELLDGVPVRAADPAYSIGGPALDGAAPDGHGLTIRLVPTPGHTADSVCFLVEHDGRRVVLTGDTILGRGTTVVAHPDGHLGDYLASLELLATYRGIPALPGHGPALADCGAAADFYLAHRRARLDQVRSALDEGARTAPEVVARVYADVDRSLWWAAEWSVRAQLEYLGRESDGGDARLDRP
ncbi:Glyoxylase, beta-lactamase superfamily II [Micromonospora phaseoli]|uniref:Glyoxylase, beta-lactamase superfamily II n=1 Tax=Micromonospora phaseoli TaxID=1144548 RepID=A0A1H7DFY7_9ACTN|nr:glyoxylase-like metal-dependent hydrolase (beta-lactamase superfamily II) [Micromonospora phaseoli]GIJ78075.1 MBL fold metallo-hydrolase [Micromonospora phaseoli]SEJ99807.1 Glyoxylase, beta-lactamase superfamily II [Micromonospora phaseoli]